ncbi:MAG: ribosome small subunit-dependent GTPase A [Steroidobacteraceae bacterium]|jgi:ribosome biogenesis GTPase|nr:ribosome small subunit-dependent GTPase A [Steroidobacteraceae bacterium]
MRQPESKPAGSAPGRIVASHGRRVLLEDASGRRLPCRLFGRDLKVVCGDRVRWRPADAEGADGLVVEVEPRRTVLSRLNMGGGSEPIVANLDRLVAVLAPAPAADLDLCDRYLAAAEWADLEAAVVLNKRDLPGASEPVLTRALDVYRRIGYAVATASKREPAGVDELARLLSRGTSVLVGQSGVGKSSLTNRLVPGIEAAVQEISRGTQEGRHTTTAAVLYLLPGGGELIDSPGVRDYAPPLPAPRNVASGFREIAAVAADCRFPDCHHRGEPGCAVEPAAAAGRVDARRLASYRQLLGLAEQFAARARSKGPPRPDRGFRR